MGNSSLNPPPPPKIKCAACLAEVKDNDFYCAACRYPIKGTAVQQAAFVASRDNLNVDLGGTGKTIKKAGNILYYLAAIFAIFGIYDCFTSKDDPDVLIIVLPMFVMAIIFLLLGEFSKKKPLACFIAGLSLYIIVVILDFIGSPASATRGILFKIAVLLALINGLKSAIQVEKVKKRVPSLKSDL